MSKGKRIATGVKTGAVVGSAIGSLVPGVGTAIGTAVGVGVSIPIALLLSKKRRAAMHNVVKRYNPMRRSHSSDEAAIGIDQEDNLPVRQDASSQTENSLLVQSSTLFARSNHAELQNAANDQSLEEESRPGPSMSTYV